MSGLSDHLLIVLIALIYPVYSTIVWNRRLRPRLEANKKGALISTFRETIIELWLLALVILFYWYGMGREFNDIGLGVPAGWAFWVGVIIWIAIAIFLGQQVSTVRTSAEAKKNVRVQFRGNEQLIIPKNKKERRWAVAASITAGICEEVVYRGFFITYLMVWFPDLIAVGISAIIFGLAHNYQGRVGVYKAILAGVILGLAFIFTGSLWVPILIHATVDITSLLSGSYAIEIKNSDDGDSKDHE